MSRVHSELLMNVHASFLIFVLAKSDPQNSNVQLNQQISGNQHVMQVSYAGVFQVTR